MLYRIITGISLSLLLAPLAFADYVQCDSKQTYCMTENKRLVVGDRVGIFNDANELVAVGEVSQMKNVKRRVEITQKMGQITTDDDVRRIDDEKPAQMTQEYTFYKAPTKYEAGAGMGLTTINLAENTNAYNAQAFAQMRYNRDYQLVGRIRYFTASGVAVDTHNYDTKENFSVQGISAMPGIAYELLPKHSFSLRAEADIGVTFISSTVSGPEAARSLDKVSNGADFSGRLAGSVLYNRVGDWHPELMTEFMMIDSSQATSISLGVIREIH